VVLWWGHHKIRDFGGSRILGFHQFRDFAGAFHAFAMMSWPIPYFEEFLGKKFWYKLGVTATI
jgi:hypothetical protein